MPSAPVFDVAVIGGGPAGSAVALRVTTHDLTAVVIDPAPHATWQATYGIWTDELPTWLPQDVVASRRDRVNAHALTAHTLNRGYAMLSTTALHQHLCQTAATPTRMGGRALGVRHADNVTTVLLAGGAEVRAKVVIDASGPRRVLTGTEVPGARAEQTAVGMILDDGGLDTGLEETLFMDWRSDHGRPPSAWPSFLYQVPLGNGRVLLEETSLARRPGLALDELRARLGDRLAARGLATPSMATADASTHDASAPDPGSPNPVIERVRFVVDTPLTRGRGPVVPFGACAPLMHPATGYSLGTAFSLADPLAQAISQTLNAGGLVAARAARQIIWSPGARQVHHLRRRGLEVILSLPPAGVVDFFETFFYLPADLQRAYISEREAPMVVMHAMWELFRAADGPLRRHLVQLGLTGPTRSARSWRRADPASRATLSS